MVRIAWWHGELEVHRLVVDKQIPHALLETLGTIARGHGLTLATDDTAPIGGDLWIGCTPHQGWGTSNSSQVGWVRAAEVPYAIQQLTDAVA